MKCGNPLLVCFFKAHDLDLWSECLRLGLHLSLEDDIALSSKELKLALVLFGFKNHYIDLALLLSQLHREMLDLLVGLLPYLVQLVQLLVMSIVHSVKILLIFVELF